MATDRRSCRGSNWYEHDCTGLAAVDQVANCNARDRPVTVRRGDGRIRRRADTKWCTTRRTGPCIRWCAACGPRWRGSLQIAAKLAWGAALVAAAGCAETTIRCARGRRTLATTAVLAALAFGAAVGAIEGVVCDVHAVTRAALSARVALWVADRAARPPRAACVDAPTAEIARPPGCAGRGRAPAAGRLGRARTTDGEHEADCEAGSLRHGVLRRSVDSEARYACLRRLGTNLRSKMRTRRISKSSRYTAIAARMKRLQSCS